MKKTLTFITALILLFCFTLPCAAQTVTTLGSTQSYVVAKYTDEIIGCYTSKATDGNASVTTGNGVTIAVKGILPNDLNLVVMPVPQSDTQAWSWFESQMSGKAAKIMPFDIFFRDEFGGMVAVASAMEVTITAPNDYTNPLIYNLLPDETLSKLNTSSAGKNLTFTYSGSGYIVLAAAVQNQGGSSGGTTYYTVTFDTNGGSNVSSQRIARNAKATKPADPAKDGYAFNGWYSDKELTKEYDFSTPVTGNMTLYAKWKESTEPKPEWKNPFIDVGKSDWFYGDVEYVHTNGLFTGTSTNTFSPNTPMTRGMLVTVLWRMVGSPATSGTPFTDVASDQYYSEAVAWAAANGIVEGIGGGLFAPDAVITREQMAAILWRYTKSIGIDVSVGENTNILSYNDAFDVSEYAIPAMQWACGAGVISGKPGGLLDPKGSATRAEVAAMLHRFIEH